MKILLVEDDAHDAEFLSMCLQRYDKSRAVLTRAQSIAEAKTALAAESFDVVLLDLNLPDANGMETIEQIQRADDSVPIVVLSGQGDEDFAVDVLSQGVQDYLVKWEGDGRIIARSIRYAIERKRTEAKLNYLARFDSLTDIPNRQYMRDQLRRATRKAHRAGKKVGLILLDLDRFKVVNDTLGHQTGDRLLCAVVDRLRGFLREGDLLARLGGDEFAIMVEDLDGAHDLETVARKILDAFVEPFGIESRIVHVSASAGLTLFPDDHSEANGLFNTADIAMYRAKEMGRNTFQFFTQDMHDAILQRHEIENDLKVALNRGEFSLVYQPQINLRDRNTHALEALIRWNHSSKGLISPTHFIPVAEESGSIVMIGMWVIDQVCQQIAAWTENGYAAPLVSINIAAMQFHQSSFIRELCAIVEAHGVSPNNIELELTERSLMDDTSYTQHCLRELRHRGFRIAIDDFGTGYSCLSYLRSFPIDVLKIDKSFVRDIGESRDGEAICSAIISMAQQLSISCVAEGIETAEQLEFLLASECTFGQGFLLSKPVNPAEIAGNYLIRRDSAATQEFERMFIRDSA